MVAFLVAALVASPAAASCVGSGAFKTCYDAQSGNNYTIQKFGNTTMMQGSNSRTGATWSQNSMSSASTTFNNGIDKDGDPWSSTCIGDFCN
ncbi:hypothetical protein [Rhizobium sp. 18065]|uniref:hypothetical protein n=1 Tax=Rhizobium sp. 18065 TaxID=2681411 RepID=UPI00190F18C4|nr:hypothetical protein [Rhizobium sp. 18065]